MHANRVGLYVFSNLPYLTISYSIVKIDCITDKIHTIVIHVFAFLSTLNHLLSKFTYSAFPKMTRVLLTGGSGFIATHILKLLLERG